MKVLFDHQIFSYQKYGGASKYFCELLDHLPTESWDTTTLFSNNEYVVNKKLFKTFHFLPQLWFKGQGRLMNELNKPYSILRLLNRNYDVFHQTHFEPYCLNKIGDKPMVTTFHDINFSTLNKNSRVELFQRKSIKRANKIIAVSHNTKNDLINYFDIDAEKIVVIHHGIDKSSVQYLSAERLVKDLYILYVGTRHGFKNFENLVRSFALLSNKYSELKLVCTHVGFTNNEINLFRELNVEDKVIHFAATEEQLWRLYRDAEMFVFPSFYEGFGMPILEAMVNRCPVVLSNCSCFPEIASDAACYFDPNSIDSIFIAMEKVLCDKEYKLDLILKGVERITHFSWDLTAAKHLEVYKLLI